MFDLLFGLNSNCHGSSVGLLRVLTGSFDLLLFCFNWLYLHVLDLSFDCSSIVCSLGLVRLRTCFDLSVFDLYSIFDLSVFDLSVFNFYSIFDLSVFEFSSIFDCSIVFGRSILFDYFTVFDYSINFDCPTIFDCSFSTALLGFELLACFQLPFWFD